MPKQYATALRRKGRKKLFDLDLEESLEVAIGTAESYNHVHSKSSGLEMVVIGPLKVARG